MFDAFIFRVYEAPAFGFHADSPHARLLMLQAVSRFAGPDRPIFSPQPSTAATGKKSLHFLRVFSTRAPVFLIAALFLGYRISIFFEADTLSSAFVFADWPPPMLTPG